MLRLSRVPNWGWGVFLFLSHVNLMPEGINQKIYWVLDQQQRGNSCGRCDQISPDDQSTVNYRQFWLHCSRNAAKDPNQKTLSIRISVIAVNSQYPMLKIPKWLITVRADQMAGMPARMLPWAGLHLRTVTTNWRGNFWSIKLIASCEAVRG